MSEWKFAHEFMRELESDPQWVAQQQAREAEWEKQEQADFVEEEPLRTALNSVGVRVSSVWDFVGSESLPPAAIPVLVRELGNDHSDGIKEGIVRALTREEGKAAWPILLKLFRERDPCSGMDGFYIALANAISVLLTPENSNDVLSILNRRERREGDLFILEAIDALGVKRGQNYFLDGRKSDY